MDVFQFFRKIFVKLELQSTKRKIIQLQITERQFLPNMYHIAITIVIYLKLSCHFLSLSLSLSSRYSNQGIRNFPSIKLFSLEN